MPHHRRRSGRPRLLVPATFGALVLAILVYAVAVPAVPGDPAGAVAGVQGVPLGPANVHAAAASPTEHPRPARLASPSAAAEQVPGGDSTAGVGTLPIPPNSLSGYQSPLPHGRITLPFGPSRWGSRVVDGELFHDGLDLATFCGDRVVAAHDGVVIAAGRHYDSAMGWIGDLQPYLDRLDEKALWSTLPIVVVIDDGNGYRSIYAHLSKVAVHRGDIVGAGDLVGKEGRTGRASGCHLHYGLFSPDDPNVFGIEPGVVERMLLPPSQIARVDPLLVLPEQPAPKPKPTATVPAAQPAGIAPPADVVAVGGAGDE